MKLKLVNYKDGEARFVVEGIEDRTFCIPLDKNITKKDVLDKLKAKLPVEDEKEKKYKELKLKQLEGTNI